MKLRDAAPGTVSHSCRRILADDEHRTVISLDDAAGNNADHAAVPTPAREYKRHVGVIYGYTHTFFLDARHDVRFGFLPVFIELVQLGRKRLGSLGVGR